MPNDRNSDATRDAGGTSEQQDRSQHDVQNSGSSERSSERGGMTSSMSGASNAESDEWIQGDMESNKNLSGSTTWETLPDQPEGEGRK